MPPLNKWRQPDSTERAHIMGVPPSVLDHVAPKSKADNRESVKCSLVGNGFHIPSAMIAIILACQMLPVAASCPAPMSGEVAGRLRGCVRGATWQPGLLDSWPRVYSFQGVLDHLQVSFQGLLPAFPLKTDPP